VPPSDDVALAREHLNAGHAQQARALLEAQVVKQPGDAELLRLLGRAFHDEGQEAKAVATWTEAQALAPLDAAALEHLASDLARDRPLADKAARALVKAGRDAREPLAGALASSSTVVRLRALAAAREIGSASGVDVLEGYLALLLDPDCDVRKAAARGLGELKDRRALPRLREKAAERNERRGLFGVLVESKPVCGAAEAAEAARRIEAR
jgi:serine/threonine-protein kinase